MASFLLAVAVRGAAAIGLMALTPDVGHGAASASIRLPDELRAGSRTIQFEGFGGFNQGEYRGGQFAGSFTRSESRLDVGDGRYVANKATATFTLEDVPELGSVSAQCRAKAKTTTVKMVTLDLKKLAYECEYQSQASTEG